MKSLLLLVIVSASSFANADSISPFKEGVYNLSGSVSYNEEDDSRFGKSTTFFASPGVLYFVSSTIAIGGRVNYWRISEDTSKYESYGVAPAFRYYFTKNHPNPFVELNYGYNTSKNSSGRGDSKTTGIIFGLNYFLAKNVALVPSVSYWRYDYKFDNNPSFAHEDKTLTMGLGISVFIY